MRLGGIRLLRVDGLPKIKILRSLTFASSKLRILDILDEPKDLDETSEMLSRSKQTVAPPLQTLVQLGLVGWMENTDFRIHETNE